MAQRGASAAYLTEINRSTNRPFHLYKGEFSSGTLYMTDANRSIVWGGQTWLGVGKFLAYDSIEEATDLIVSEINLTLTGVSTDIIAIVMTENLIERPVTIYRGFLDLTTYAVVVDPIIIFKGRTDGGSVGEDPDNGTAIVELPCSSKLIDFDRVKGRRTNTTSQRQYYPFDKGFNFVPGLSEKIVVWKPPTP